MADTPIGSVAPVTEATAPAEQKPASEQPNPQLEAFARKEKQLRKMQQDLQAEKAQMMAKVKEYETGYIPKSRIKDDFWGAIGEAGIDQQMLIEQLANQPNMNDPTTKALYSKLKAMEEKFTASERAAADQQTAQYQQAVKQITNEVKMLIDSSEAYESIKAMGAETAVVELIEENFNSTGTLMDIEDAAAQVEEYILKEAKKMAGLKKLQAKSEQQEQAPVASQAVSKSDAKRLNTLTNAVPTQATGRLTEKQRIERAMAAFHGTLKG